MLGYMYGLINMVIDIKSDLFFVLLYFLAPATVIAFGLLIFSFMRKAFPKITGLITGGRL